MIVNLLKSFVVLSDEVRGQSALLVTGNNCLLVTMTGQLCVGGLCQMGCLDCTMLWRQQCFVVLRRVRCWAYVAVLGEVNVLVENTNGLVFLNN